MIALDLETIAQAVNGKLVGENITVSQVFTDTRKEVAESLFVALIGENFDAHNFAEQAKEQGAIALLVSKEVETKLPMILVEDTEKALGKLANLVRNKVKPKVIGITGSAGKTSVKEMVAQILNQIAGEESVLATAGNFNNHIGVPLTLLNLTEQHKFAVIEMGANHIGEIQYCVSVAGPDAAVVNNVAPAHIEGFGSIEGVAKAKGEIYQELSNSDVGVINLDSDFSEDYLKLDNFQKVTVSRHNSADFEAHNIRLDNKGCARFDMKFQDNSIEINLPVAGEHQVSNALVAGALSYSVGASLENIKKGLESSSQVAGRLNSFKGLAGSSVIDDSYNASVASVKVAIDVLSHWDGDKYLVLGDMAELGEESKVYHQEVGLYAKENCIDHLWAIGNWTQYSCESFGNGSKHFSSKESLIDELKQNINKKSQVLIKGSRSARMEDVVEALTANTKQTQDEQLNSLGGGSQC